MSFIKELKRRNVFRVGIAYAVTAWLLIQVTDILLESIGTPPWVMQTMFVVLGVGFIIAIFFAWAFELTPEGVKREADVDRSQSITGKTGRKLDFTIIGILVLALGYFVVDKFYLTPAAGNPQATEVQTTEPAQDKKDEPQTIAVLPFADMSQDGDNEYFSDGLTEELLNILAKIRELRVAGRTSSFAFKGKNEDLRSIGEKLNVATILEGSVRKDDKRNRVRITAQLINVEDGYHLWSETYDRDLEDIFAIQEEIARKVAKALRITLLGEDEERIAEQVVTDLSSYDLYLQGLKSYNEFSWASLERAIEEFGRAIELDPDYIPAQIKWAATWLELANAGGAPKNEARSKAVPVLEKILKEDPGNSEVHTVLARFHRLDRNTKAAEQEFQFALDTNPRNAIALAELGRVLFGSGKVNRAMEYLNEAGRIDPYSVQVLWNLAMTHSMMLQPEKSTEYARRIGEVESDNPMQFYGPAMAYSLSGNHAQAIFMDKQAIELDPNDYELVAGMAIRWTVLGDLEQAELWARKADDMAADQPVPIKARLGLYQFREQYSLAGDLAKRALDRELDDRQLSKSAFRNAWIGSLVHTNRIDEALDYYKKTLPEVFETPPAIKSDSNRNFSQLVEVAMLLQMQDPNSPLATILIDAAEQKLELVEDRWIPWWISVRRATIATARGDKAAAIAYLNTVPGGKFGGNWRNYLGNWWVLDTLHGEPEYKQLIAMLEEDMDRQREEAYELLGMNK